MIWSTKYSPKKISEVVRSDAFEKLYLFIKDYRAQRKRAAILYGCPGVGKTCSVYAIANELGLEIVELNASDFRNKQNILEIVGGSLKQQSLFHKGKVILIDEVDGLSGTKDRGAIPSLVSLIKDSVYPIILTCTDPFDSKFSSLRSKCHLLEFPEIDYLKQVQILQRVCESENLDFDTNILKSIARRSGGDLRAAINDLQALYSGRKSIKHEDLDVVDSRKKEEEITNALKLIFKTKNMEAISLAVDNLDVNLDELFMWVDHNLPLEYDTPSDAYDSLSKADVFRGRIRRWQHWRFLVYLKYFMSMGVAISKGEKSDREIDYKRSDRILKLWLAKMRYAKRNSIANKLASEFHMSEKKLLKDMPYLIRLSGELGDYDLENDEVDWLKSKVPYF